MRPQTERDRRRPPSPPPKPASGSQSYHGRLACQARGRASYCSSAGRRATVCRGWLLPAGGRIKSWRHPLWSDRVDVTSGNGTGRGARQSRARHRSRRGRGSWGRRVDRRGGGNRCIAVRNRGLARHGIRGRGSGRSLHSWGDERRILGRPVDRRGGIERATHERPAGGDTHKCEKWHEQDEKRPVGRQRRRRSEHLHRSNERRPAADMPTAKFRGGSARERVDSDRVDEMGRHLP